MPGQGLERLSGCCALPHSALAFQVPLIPQYLHSTPPSELHQCMLQPEITCSLELSPLYLSSHLQDSPWQAPRNST